MKTILIVDDHKLIRDGLASYFSNDSEYEIKDEASNGIEALEKLEQNKVDFVLTDISMPYMDGIELTKKIHKEYPEIKIIALTMWNDNARIKKMMNAGAEGYVLKDCTEGELRTALDEVGKGGTYYSSEVTETVMNALMNKKGKQIGYDVPLTEREKEVLKLIVEENSNQEIADKLFISPRTVDAHKRNLLEKTGSKNVAGLVMYAIHNNLTDNI